MKIYLSEFKIFPEYDRENSYSEFIDRFLFYCKKRNISVIRSDEFTDYATINTAIDDSDILIAFVDEWWLSSTWKAHEVFYLLNRDVEKNNDKSRIVLFLIDIDVPNLFKSVQQKVKIITTYEGLENYIENYENV